jgi:hypothetical protein
MSRFDLRMPSPNGVKAGQTALFNLSLGNRYHELQLSYAGVTLAQLTEIRVKINGTVKQIFSATDRDKWNQFDKIAAAAGILVIPFDRQKLRTLAAEEETAIDTGAIVAGQTGERVTSFSIEVDIDAAAAAPVLEMNATVSETTGRGVGTVLHIRRDTRTFGGAGRHDISDLPFNSVTAAYLNRVTFSPSVGEVSETTVKRNNVTIFERKKALNERLQANGIRVPQTGFQIIDTTEKGIGGNVFNLMGAQDFRYELVTTGAGANTVTVYSEYLGRLGD